MESEVLHFAGGRWRALLRHPTDPTLSNRELEVCVLSYIGGHLHAGNLCVAGSEALADQRAEVLPWPECERVKMGADGRPVLLKYSGRTMPESAQRLHIEVMRPMPQRSLLDILVNVGI